MFVADKMRSFAFCWDASRSLGTCSVEFAHVRHNVHRIRHCRSDVMGEILPHGSWRQNHPRCLDLWIGGIWTNTTTIRADVIFEPGYNISLHRDLAEWLLRAVITVRDTTRDTHGEPNSWDSHGANPAAQFFPRLLNWKITPCLMAKSWNYIELDEPKKHHWNCQRVTSFFFMFSDVHPLGWLALKP